jgi:hypothetical protein
MLLGAAPVEKSGIIPADESISPPAAIAAALPRNMLATRLLNCKQEAVHVWLFLWLFYAVSTAEVEVSSEILPCCYE